MTKDMLGPAVRALVSVPQEHFGLIAKIANRLSSSEKESWAEAYGEIEKWKIPTWPTLDKWRTFTIGGYTTHQLRQGVANTHAKWMLDTRDFKTQSNEFTVDTIILSPLALGFRSVTAEHFLNPDTLEVWSKRNEVRLKGRKIALLPPDAAPRIRNQFREQSDRDKLHVAMAPIKIRPDEWRIFSLDRDPGYGQELSTLLVGSSMQIDPDAPFLFRLL